MSLLISTLLYVAILFAIVGFMGALLFYMKRIYGELKGVRELLETKK